jgi:hypothetical protein
LDLPFHCFPLDPILQFSMAVCFLALSLHVKTIVVIFLQLLLKCKFFSQD